MTTVGATTILHLSDPHFGTERAAVVDALFALRNDQSPDLVILSGDITQRARRGQFRIARAFVDRLNVMHTLVLPGNHDIPMFNLAARFFYPYANYCREFGSELEPCFESERVLAIGVNTTRRYRRKDGEVSIEQVERVATRLARALPQQLRIVVTHQPVAVLREEDACNLLYGHEQAARTWAAAGADLILGGHIHLPYIAALHERWPDLRHAWVLQAGTAVSRRTRHEADNSVNVLRYEGANAHACVTVERWDYFEQQKRFRTVQTVELPLQRKSHD